MTSKEESREESTHRVATSGDLEVSAYLEIARENQGEQPLPEGSPAAPGGEAVVILDFGSQYSQLIARRVRECKVYCELMPFDAPWEQVAALQPRGIILSGGPASVYDPGAPLAPPYVFESRLPVLGICYGMQLLAHQMGGKVGTAPRREYGHAILHQSDDSPLFHALPTSINVWMSHGDQIVELPPGFRTLASTENAPIAAMGNDEGAIGIQFHPEVVHTPQGKDILRNFLYRICGCHGTWTAASFIQDSISRIRRQVDTGRVLCALSGGVDSSVAATLIHKAVGDQLTCIFVNNGLLRKEEAERTLRTFQRHLNMDLIYVDASERFLSRLSGIVDP
ncbi:MAG: glutamine-hydrolyzing GMP synthase, partial [Dehalococcoidia bacterium]|nr:glutamine-hydrolyzing GMP synthase [Dehalococcoidia bacterium]